jgi:hypothetical protein
MNLVWKVGETNVAHQFFTNDGGNGGVVSSWKQRRVGTIGHAIWGYFAIAGGSIWVRHLGKQKIWEGGSEQQRQKEKYFWVNHDGGEERSWASTLYLFGFLFALGGVQ